MLWVSYCTIADGYRHRLIEAARKKRVRFFASDYILDELVKALVEDLHRSRRYAGLARRAARGSRAFAPRDWAGWFRTCFRGPPPQPH